MNYYLVVSASQEKLGLEDLSFKNASKRAQIVVTRRSLDTLLRDDGKTAKIKKILPADFKLSKFNDGNGQLICDAKNSLLLYDISSHVMDFTISNIIEKGSVIGLSEWE